MALNLGWGLSSGWGFSGQMLTMRCCMLCPHQPTWYRLTVKGLGCRGAEALSFLIGDGNGGR